MVPVKRFARRSARSPPGVDATRKPELVAAMVADVLEAIGRARRSSGRSWSARSRGRGGARRGGAGAELVCATSRTRATAPRRWPGSPRRGRAGRAAWRCCPGTARCSTRASSTAADRRPRPLRRGDPRPPRDRNQRARAGAARRDRAELRRGQPRAPRRPPPVRAGIPYAVEELPSLGLDLDTPADIVALTIRGARRRREADREGRGMSAPTARRTRRAAGQRWTARSALRPGAGLPEIAEGDPLGGADRGARRGARRRRRRRHLAEGRLQGRGADAAAVERDPGAEAGKLARVLGKEPNLVQLILEESAEVVRAERGVLIVETQARARLRQRRDRQLERRRPRVGLLLPEDPDASARRLRAEIGGARGADRRRDRRQLRSRLADRAGRGGDRLRRAASRSTTGAAARTRPAAS